MQLCPGGQVSEEEGSESCDKCKPGTFKGTTTAIACSACVPGQYSEDSGANDQCTPCEKSQISPYGSTQRTQCFFTYQVAQGADAGVCTGRGDDDSKSPLARIAGAQGCQAYADNKNSISTDGETYAFKTWTDAESKNFEACENTYKKSCSEGSVDCTEEIYQTECRVTCGTCGSESAAAAGCIKVPDKTNSKKFTVYHFESPDKIQLLVFPINYTPVCKSFFCNSTDLDVRDYNLANAQRSSPRCTVSDQALDALKQDERAQFLVFILVGIAISLVNTGIAYYVALDSNTLTIAGVLGLPRKAHLWVILGVVAKVFDMLTDFGFLFITLGLPGDTSNRFYKHYDADLGVVNANAIRTASLVFCILGGLLTFPDVYGNYVIKLKKGATDKAKGRAMVWSILSIFLEDIPQLSLSLVYLGTINFADESAEDKAMAIISLLLSVGTILDRMHTVFKLHKRGITPSICGGCAANQPGSRNQTQHGRGGAFGRPQQRGNVNARSNPVKENPAFTDTTCSYQSAESGNQCAEERDGAAQFCWQHRCPKPGCPNPKRSSSVTCPTCADATNPIYGTSANTRC